MYKGAKRELMKTNASAKTHNGAKYITLSFGQLL
jgi:hypothetical protein